MRQKTVLSGLSCAKYSVTIQKLNSGFRYQVQTSRFYSIKHSWHAFCLYIGGACKSLEFLRQGLVKSVIGVMLKQSELSLLTITDDRIFIEKLATFSIKANAASRAVPVC